MREATITRTTAETDITVKIMLDGSGKSTVNTGNGFFDHMLTLFARHGLFDLEVNCNGDTNVDFHHSAEDIGIALGKAVRESLGDMAGITRFADVTLPMDEALVLCAVDISGRGFLSFDLPVPSQKIGEYDSELTEEFFRAFAVNAGLTLHLRRLAGSNSHHITEAAFKALGRTLRTAVSSDFRLDGAVPSTKGVL